MFQSSHTPVLYNLRKVCSRALYSQTGKQLLATVYLFFGWSWMNKRIKFWVWARKFYFFYCLDFYLFIYIDLIGMLDIFVRVIC